jgi:hypothetical protein
MSLARLGLLVVIAVCLHAGPGLAATESVPMKMGFYLPAIRDANQTDIKVSLGVWIDEVRKPMNIQVTTATYDDITAMRRALDQSDVNFISAPGMELAEVFTPDEIRAGYARRHHGIDEGMALLVAGNSGLRTFADLRGKRVSKLSHDRLSDIFLEIQCLKTGALACQDFMRLSEEKRDIQSVYNVFFGRADAALVSLTTLRTATELNPQVGQRVRVLLDWKAKALMFGMMTRYSQESNRQLILSSVKEAMKTARGRQILELFKTDYLEPVDADALKPYWALLREYRELRRGMTTKKK